MSVTTSNPRRVNPACRPSRGGSLAVGDIIRGALDTVRPSRGEVVVVAVVLPGRPVDVGLPPRIERHWPLEVRSLPAGGARGGGPQRCQSLSRGRITTVVHLEQIERSLQMRIHVDVRRSFLRLLAPPRKARNDHGPHNAHNNG